MTDIIARLSTALADRYTIEHEIGAGGMATVYLAHDIKHNRKVAVKVLRPELSAILGGERFLKEIEVTANLQHPNILPLYDSGEADSNLFDSRSFEYSQSAPMYDVSRDGQTFLVLRGQQTTATDVQPIVVLNWFEEIERRMAEQGGR